MFLAARAHFAARHIRQTLDTLHAAHTFATGHGFHREAAQLKRALSILNTGGRPKLLGRMEARLGDREER